MQDDTWNSEWPKFKSEMKALYTITLNQAEAASVVSTNIHGQTAAYQGTVDLLAKLMGA